MLLETEEVIISVESHLKIEAIADEIKEIQKESSETPKRCSCPITGNDEDIRWRKPLNWSKMVVSIRIRKN